MSAAEALRKARELILEDCAALVACHTHPVSGELDDEAAIAARARYHKALAMIDAALDAGQAQPVPGVVWGLYGEDGACLVKRGTEDEQIARHGGSRVYTAPQASQPVAPAGWKLVPVEPTQEMCQEGQWKAREWPKFPLRISPIYQAMISAAPPAHAAQPNRFDYLKLIRADFEDRMRAQGESEVALTRLAGHGEYVSPRVQEAWEAEKRKYAAPKQQPLTDEQHRALREQARQSPEAEHTVWWLLYGRLVERAHGIGAQP